MKLYSIPVDAPQRELFARSFGFVVALLASWEIDFVHLHSMFNPAV